MKTATKYILTAVIGIAIGILIMFLMQKCTPNVPAEPVVIHDTIEVSNPADIEAHTKPKYIVKWDTLYMPKDSSFASEDSCSHKDTMPYVAIPITAYEYRDTFSTDSSRTELAVRFSGYHAKIDSIGLTQEWTVQPQVVDKKKGFRWFVGPSVQVGYGVAFGQPIIAAPYVGVGVSIGFGWTFSK